LEGTTVPESQPSTTFVSSELQSTQVPIPAGYTQQNRDFLRRLNDPLAGLLPDPSADTQFIVFQPVRSFNAFAEIVLLLQLPCSYEEKIFSDPVGDIPSAMRSTEEQKTIPHLMYVDLLPWRKLRANLLKSIATINQIEFTQEMYNGSLKVWSTPWDPMSWEASEEFVNKWWFLIDSSILHTTNFWRRHRGEAPIRPLHRLVEASD
jgi:hypothetical protein